MRGLTAEIRHVLFPRVVRLSKTGLSTLRRAVGGASFSEDCHGREATFQGSGRNGSERWNNSRHKTTYNLGCEAPHSGALCSSCKCGTAKPHLVVVLYKQIVPITGQGDGCAILSNSTAIPGSAYKSVQTVGGGTLCVEMQEGTFAPIEQN